MAGVSEMGVTGFRTSSIKDGQKFKNFAGPRNAVTGGMSATGGDEIQTVGGFKYHVFTSSSNFVLSSNPYSEAVEILVAGGGAGGGSSYGAGGGAGELDLFTSQTLSAGTYTVTIGSGSSGATNSSTKASNGGQSQFIGTSTITALGGGAGGCGDNGSGSTGGRRRQRVPRPVMFV